MAILRVKKGPLEGAEFPVFSTREPTVIGRAPDVEISLRDQRASRRHAEISLDRGRWIVRDLGSSNGTILAGKRVSRALLTDGALLQVGSHQLSFREHELATPAAEEFYGTQLLEAVREAAGVFVCRGYQRAMDREVRADWLHPMRCPEDPAVVAALTEAIEEARSLGGRLAPVLRGEVRSASDGGPPSASDKPRGTWVILGGEIPPSLESELDAILALDRAARVALFRQLVERVLERAASPGHAYPVGLASVGVGGESGSPPRLTLPAFDLGAWVAGRTGAARHLRSFAAYLAPEHEDAPPAAWRAAVTYNLGALGHHLLTGRVPSEEGSSISDDDTVPADLAALVDRMLSPDPSLRPAAGGELLDRLREVIPDDHSSSGPHPDAAATEDDEILAELENGAQSRQDRPRPPAPSGGSARATRPARPISRRHRATGRPSLIYLPLWFLLWIGLFLAARYLSKIAFHELGL